MDFSDIVMVNPVIYLYRMDFSDVIVNPVIYLQKLVFTDDVMENLVI